MDVGWELVMFCVGKSPDAIPQNEDDSQTFSTLVADREEREWQHNHVEDHLPDWDPVIEWQSNKPRDYSVNEPVVRKFHREAKEILDRLFAGQPWEIAPPSKTHVFQLTHVKKKLIQINLTPQKPSDIFISRIFELIRDEEERLNICANPKCKKVRFVATKKNRAKYCSTRCSTYVHVAKNRGKKL
jgi:hypothetical protein